MNLTSTSMSISIQLSSLNLFTFPLMKLLKSTNLNTIVELPYLSTVELNPLSMLPLPVHVMVLLMNTSMTIVRVRYPFSFATRGCNTNFFVPYKTLSQQIAHYCPYCGHKLQAVHDSSGYTI